MKPIVYGSVCSGIEAATVAWHPLGWKPSFFSEIEKFPRQVLTHHYPSTPLHGDFTTIQTNDYNPIDLLVGGTPCQAFSVAGLRKGLDDPRGNLTLSFLGLAERLRPKWIVWENVPGVLSIDGGRAFGSFLGGMAQLGYGFAYRVLDAQYFGVPQRRRRVFVVGYFGDYRRAASVLFERECLRRHTAPFGKKRKSASTFTQASIGEYGGSSVGSPLRASGGDCGGGSESVAVSFKANMSYPATYQDGIAPTLEAMNQQAIAYSADVAPTLDKGIPGRGAGSLNAGDGHLIATPFTIAPGVGENRDQVHASIPAPTAKTLSTVQSLEAHQGGTGVVTIMGSIAKTLTAHPQRLDADIENFAVVQPTEPHAIALAENTIGRQPHNGGNGDGFTEGGPMYTLNTSGVHAIAFEPGKLKRLGEGINGDIVGTLRASGSDNRPAVAVDAYNQSIGDVSQALRSGANSIEHTGGVIDKRNLIAVRRLTPTECERLQGFPDGYTDIKFGGKQTPDGPRYKALGNSMAVPVMAWIGRRIQIMEDLIPSDE
jgi:DNA (cytosine-5)-methyltransferase 1